MTINQKIRLKKNKNKLKLIRIAAWKKSIIPLNSSKITKGLCKRKLLSNELINLFKKPQFKGIITKLYTLTPKKPNSALRKVAKVQLFKNKTIVAYIPGEKHTYTLHNMVLIKPGKTQDLPGVKFKIIRGALLSK